jgi:hypothetical protein
MVNEEHLTQLKQGFLDVLARARHVLASGAAHVYVGGRTWIADRQVEEAIRRTHQRVMARLRSTSWQEVARQYLPLLVGLGVLLLLFALWKLPQWYAASWNQLTDPKDIAKLESDTRTTLVQAVGGLALFLGLFFTAKTWRTTQEGQITDRFTKAINQLGEAGPEKLAIRLGGIYALERIARDSERDHWPIMEVLTAYVREKAPWKEEEQHSLSKQQPTQNTQPAPKLAADIQAVLTVLGRRTRTFRQGESERLNLGYTDLRGAVLRDAQLQEAHLERAQLQGANLARALLQGARLDGAQLEKADLVNALLQGADLRGAQLQGADLRAARLEKADLRAARLEKADLRSTRLEGATNLTVAQLSTVKTLYQAQLDPPLREQIQQQSPQLLEKPRE